MSEFFAIISIGMAGASQGAGRRQYLVVRLGTLHIDAAPQRYSNFGDRVMRGVLV
jgi:hypothetical protein